MVDHGNSTIGLEEINGTAIVVSEDGSLRLKRRVCIGESEEVLTNKPFNVFAVR